MSKGLRDKVRKNEFAGKRNYICTFMKPQFGMIETQGRLMVRRAAGENTEHEAGAAGPGLSS